MKLWSNSWTNGDRIPPRYAAGKADGAGGATFSDRCRIADCIAPGAVK